MPGPEFARQRIKERFLTHRYTRVPRGQVPVEAAPADRDPWGQPVPRMQPDAGAPQKMEELECLYLAAGTYTLTPIGPIQTDRPTLLVAYDDELQIGDQVEHIYDPQSNFELQAYAGVQSMVPAANSGSPIFLIVNLLEAEVV